jgi:hypothetical protein
MVVVIGGNADGGGFAVASFFGFFASLLLRC